MRRMKLTTVIKKDSDGYTSLYPELDIASQGDSHNEARSNLTEAVEGFLESASETEIANRLRTICG